MRVLVLLAFLSPLLLEAQSLTVNNVSMKDGTITLDYSLLDSVRGRSFLVSLYTSRDNYINPVTALSGDFGIGVKAGKDKRMVWNAREEFGATYAGRVSLEVRARVYVPFILFDDFAQIKRGKPKDVTWSGGARQSTLNFELYNKHDERVTTIPNINAQAGHTQLYIPNDVKPGKGYRFKITDSRNKDQVVYTQPFVIRRKIPLLFVALPVVAVGAVITVVGGGGGDSGPGEIGSPPLPPEN